MKKSVLIVLLICFQGIAQKSNKKAEVMASVICECLENKDKKELATDPNELFGSCYKGAVFAALISNLDTTKDNTITLNTDGSSDEIGEAEREAAIKILESECEIFQELRSKSAAVNEKVTGVSHASCECIGKIPTDWTKEEKGKAMQECVSSSVSELREELDIKINSVEEIRSFYSEVNNYLVDNCKAVKIVAFSDDQEKLYSYSGNEKAMELYDKGQEWYLQNNFKKAIKYYEKAVKEDPKFVFAWDNLGRSYREVNKFDKAIDAYKSSIAIDSLNRTALMNLAVAYSFKKDFQNSEFWYKKLVNIDTEDPEGHYGLALSYMYQNKLEQSLNSVVTAHEMYRKINSPYVADAEKVMRYLKQLFQQENKSEEFNTILEKHEISLD